MLYFLRGKKKKKLTFIAKYIQTHIKDKEIIFLFPMYTGMLAGKTKFA